MFTASLAIIVGVVFLVGSYSAYRAATESDDSIPLTQERKWLLIRYTRQ